MVKNNIERYYERSNINSKETIVHLQSKVIAFMRFPLIVAVVFIHTSSRALNIDGISFEETNSLTLYSYISFLISDVFARIAVPLFFFFSGFLFFKGIFNIHSYIKKLKSRVKTLFIPYLFWNLVVVVLLFILQTLSPGHISENSKPVTEYDLLDWLKIFWDKDDGMPICYQFWFLRDLMVTMVLSPILFWGIKYAKWVFVLILGILWFFNIWFNVVGLSITALFFFSFGAYFNITHRIFLLSMKPLRKYAVGIYPFLSVISLFFMGTPICKYIVNISIIVGIIGSITLTGYLIDRGKCSVNSFLSESSFFIYAYHATMIAIILQLGAKFITLSSSLGMICLYLVTALLTVIVGLIIYYFLKKVLPNFTSFITGNR